MIDWNLAYSQHVANVLPQCEPLAGGGLAICIAYLNLRRFRYREKIIDQAIKNIAELERLGASDPPAFRVIKALPQYEMLERLAQLGDVRSSQSLTVGENIYHGVFTTGLDRILAVCLSIIAFIILVTGVTSNIWPHWEPVFMEWLGGQRPKTILALSIASGLVPGVLVTAGFLLTRVLVGDADSATKVFGRALANQAQHASGPTVIGNGSP